MTYIGVYIRLPNLVIPLPCRCRKWSGGSAFHGALVRVLPEDETNYQVVTNTWL